MREQLLNSLIAVGAVVFLITQPRRASAGDQPTTHRCSPPKEVNHMRTQLFRTLLIAGTALFVIAQTAGLYHP